MLKTSLELHDNFSASMHKIIAVVDKGINAMAGLHSSVSTPINTSAITDIGTSLGLVADDVNDFSLDPVSDSVATSAQEINNTLQSINESFNLDAVEQKINKTAKHLEDSLNISSEVNIEVNADTTKLNSGIANINKTLKDSVSLNSEIDVKVNADTTKLDSGIERAVNSTKTLSNSFEGVKSSVDQATSEIGQFETTLKSVENFKPPVIEFDWETPNFEVFTNSGIDRFSLELQNANILLEEMNQNQITLSSTAAQMDLVPDGLAEEISHFQMRIESLKSSMLEMSNIPVCDIDESVNNRVEQLRESFSDMIGTQREINRAVKSLDFSKANRTCLDLHNKLNRVDRQIRNNTSDQQRFNKKLQESHNPAGKLLGVIKSAIGAYVSLNGLKAVIDISDNMTSVKARLDLMNDGLQTTDELQQQIYESAQRSRGSFQDTADAVSKLGLMAGSAFSSSSEIITFAEQLNKHFVVAGTEASGVSSAMLQLTQAMGSGVLRGEEFNSILEQAPNVIQTIADYMGVLPGEMKNLAGEGKISASIIKEALLSSANDAEDGINAKFESMPKTFSQIGTSIKNTALIAFQPVLDKISEIANSPQFDTMVQTISSALSKIGLIMADIFDAATNIGTYISDNWSLIAPVIFGIVGALAAYKTMLSITGVIASVQTLITNALAAAKTFETGATIGATVAQHGLNAALLACPITWIILGIILLIAVVWAVASAVAHFTGAASSGFSLICGAVNVVIKYFENMFKSVANVGIGIWNALSATAHNIKTAFSNSIKNVQSFFWDLLGTALDVISEIAEKLNKLPFVNIDTTGLINKSNEFHDKAEQIRKSKGEYKDIVGEFNKGMNTFKTFEKGWMKQSFDEGAAWGDKVGDKVKNIFSGGKKDDGGGGDKIILPNPPPAPNPPPIIPDPNGNKNLGKIGGGVANLNKGMSAIAADTSDIKDSMETSEEDLKYLLDVREREIVNRYYSPKISYSINNQNTVNSDMDLDGVIHKMAAGIQEAIDKSAEAVHI